MRREYERRWQLGGMSLLLAYADSMNDVEANNTVADFIKKKIQETVHDPTVAEALLPEHVYACKRPCMDTHYFETYNRPNVTLVDCRTVGIERITRKRACWLTAWSTSLIASCLRRALMP